MTTMTFDRLAYIDRLKSVGFTDPQARGMADGLDQALREEVATKSDLAILRSDLMGEIGSVRGEVTSLKGEVVSLKSELKGEVASVKVDLMKWFVALLAGQTALFTALRILGH